MKVDLNQYAGVENIEGSEHEAIEKARVAFFEANPQLAEIISASQMSVPQIVEALQEYQTIGERPKEHTHHFGWNPHAILETSPVFQILGVSNIRDYPEGIRAGLKKLFDGLDINTLTHEQHNALLYSLRTEGFKHIDIEMMSKIQGCSTLTPQWVVNYTIDRMKWLEQALMAVLEIIEPRTGYVEKMPVQKQKGLDEIIPAQVNEVLTGHEAYRKLANEPVTPSPMQIEFDRLIGGLPEGVVDAIRSGSITLPTAKAQEFTQVSVPEGEDPLEYLVKTVTEAWNSGADVLSLKGIQALRPIGHEIDLAKTWESTKPNGK